MRELVLHLLWFGGVALVSVPASASGQARFERVKGLSGRDAVGTSAVSADGAVVVGATRTPSGSQAFRSTLGGSAEGLGPNAGGFPESAARDVSGDGKVIVGNVSQGLGKLSQGFIWRAETGMVSLGAFGGDPNTSVYVGGVSRDGTVVVGSAGRGSAFRWTQSGGFVPLPGLATGGGPRSSGASDVSADGSVVVGYSQSDDITQPLHAVRWTGTSAPVQLMTPSGVYQTIATTVSSDGAVAAGTAQTDVKGVFVDRAFRWTSDGVYHPLAPEAGGPRYQEEAYDTNGDGSLIVGRSERLGAFIWDEAHGMRSLQRLLTEDYGLGSQLKGISLYNATAISDDGLVITGSYETVPDDPNPRSFIVVLPEPSALGVLMISGSSLLRRRRHV